MSEVIEESQVPMTLEPVQKPETVTTNGLKAVTHLMKILDEKPDKVMINGKRHIEFDDWVLLGQFYGVDVDTSDEAEPVEVFGVKGFKAKASVINIKTGRKVGGATAYCMSNEKNWINKPFFQLASMAQTRAGSKALANILRGFVALKGISGTPAEEMIMGNGRKPAPAQGKKKPTRKPARARASDEEAVDDIINNAVDAEYQVKKKTPSPAKQTKKTDEAETVDMAAVDLTKIKGINDELDKWIHTVEDVGANRDEVIGICQDLLGENRITDEEVGKVKEALGGD
jgi:hypothetical protein